MAECLTVDQDVAGSTPVSHPFSGSFYFYYPRSIPQNSFSNPFMSYSKSNPGKLPSFWDSFENLLIIRELIDDHATDFC